ncbi:hypothetical protein B0G84_8164 [Paraburkholderia sp. BL8N3]|nr:hypothetical protein B0G84_8164 [Paraburkholderia sp. BL8N3]
MLSLHECAVLLLVKNAPDQVDPIGADLQRLLACDLVVLERSPCGRQSLRLTADGHVMLGVITSSVNHQHFEK